MLHREAIVDSYTLRIHHLDFGNDGGDATLLAVWDVSQTQPALRILVLIDGGSTALGAVTVRRALDTYGLTGLTPQTAIVITTHYENAYFAGLVDILTFPEFARATLWDRGQQGTVTRPSIDYANTTVNYWGETGTYTSYKQLIAYLTTPSSPSAKPLMTWNTARLATTSAAFLHPAWTAGIPFFGTGGGSTILDDSAVTGLSITVAAADSFIAGSMLPAANNSATDDTIEFDNGYALIIGFGTFRYYHGGAITTTQEGGTPVTGVEPSNGAPTVHDTLHSAPVHVAKLSRQGALTASAPDFLSSIGAPVLIVTCGTDRGAGDDSEVFAESVSYPAQTLPQAVPNGAVAYLTGETLATALDGPNVVIAGCWSAGSQVPLAYGDVTIEVVGSDATAFSVKYAAPPDAWTQTGANKTYAQAVAYCDQYPMQTLSPTTGGAA